MQTYHPDPTRRFQHRKVIHMAFPAHKIGLLSVQSLLYCTVHISLIFNLVNFRNLYISDWNGISACYIRNMRVHYCCVCRVVRFDSWNLLLEMSNGGCWYYKGNWRQHKLQNNRKHETITCLYTHCYIIIIIVHS